MHGVNGWRWEVSEAIPLFSGEYDLKLIDSSGNYARFGMLLVTDDEELNSFLFSLGCYSGEPITVISHLKGGCVVSIKDGRYNIDNELAGAIEI